MVIEIENLRLRFPEAEERRFDRLNISIRQGEKVLLLGPSGSGKSTLLNLLGGNIPRSMDIPFKADVLTVDPKAAYVFQDPDSQFTMPTVGEELAFILENRRIPRPEMGGMMEDALRAVGLRVEFTMAINDLSGGMKQRLAIASALLQGADTLLLDEPTSMLDEAAVTDLWGTLQDVWHDKTVVIVEHRVNEIWNKVDRVILMDAAGQLIIDEAPEAVMRDHIELLNDYGVWHPHSWDYAPVFETVGPRDEAVIEVRDMKLARGGRTLLNIDALNVKKGEWLTIEGENGTGKTTLMLAILKLIKSEGHIHVNGRRVKKTKDIAGTVYPVFQNPELQFMTNKVFDEVFINLEMHYPRDEAERRCAALLERIGLRHVSHLHPLEISTGQKRRLSVVTAAGGVPEVIIFDEPTFGLDQKLSFELLKMFNELVEEGVTVIMITHDSEIKKRYPSRRLIIEEGQLKEIRGAGHA
ncbi:ABC transporter ATP-binding protein [Lacicoccus alkaliphilus]|uniref:Energy-coupling factor transport system ATP-binding protein n=1 Tax=Lacicoccus alkaliphilus DSM 16010 TaxID=1123231 RepID=A0A1M7C153_9BACL|nr:ABC transporter ATP-binding protein [Salinicoccus alkaliphilus]SHL61048.1 energy-coupling factor transport system ATP-binding protein [Salinicoccus alkaliphilus DSM 16010]